jgi:dUTPase
MKNNYWKENKKNFVNSKLPVCSANNYYKPNIQKISTEIFSDDDAFVPVYSNSFEADFYINIYESKISINNLGVATVDCGFSVKIPMGYKMCFSLDENWSSKGLFISGHGNIEPNEKSRVKINLINFGNMIVMNHGEKLGTTWIEPVYFFEWIKT